MKLDGISVRYGAARERWIVDIPAELSGSKKRERRSFKTQKEAEGFRKAEEVRVANQGTGAAQLSRMERDVAAKVLARLREVFPEPVEVLLMRAVDEFIAANNARARSKTLLEGYRAWETYALARTRNGKPTSDKYQTQIRTTLPRFKILHDKMLCDITPDDIGAAIEGVSPHAKNALLRVIRACFNYAKDRGWLSENPVRPKQHFAGTGVREPSVLTSEQVRRLLAKCVELDPEMLGFYCIALFAGVRPTDEMTGLRWEHVFADGGKTIWIPSAIAKTRRERHVQIESTLNSWLSYIKPPQEGLVTPKRNLIKRRRAIERGAGIHPWPQDVMRHTYASCWMAVFRDEARCRDNMGHRTQDELHRHYRRHLREEDARAFWSLEPSAVLQG
ncbi:MAG: hypothetical protein RLZZ142_2164 [Verrucomicrobiota bacterium]